MPPMSVGARQRGKTYILEKFCKNNYENYIYINLDKEKSIQEWILKKLSKKLKLLKM